MDSAMNNCNYRPIYVGDDEGEMELRKFIEAGWKTVTDKRKRVYLRDNMVIVFKEQTPISELKQHVPFHEDSKAYVLYSLIKK